MPDRPHVRLAEVFVTADPDYTYSSRDSAKLEDAVKDHLEVGSAAAWCVGCGGGAGGSKPPAAPAPE